MNVTYDSKNRITVLISIFNLILRKLFLCLMVNAIITIKQGIAFTFQDFVQYYQCDQFCNVPLFTCYNMDMA